MQSQRVRIPASVSPSPLNLCVPDNNFDGGVKKGSLWFNPFDSSYFRGTNTGRNSSRRDEYVSGHLIACRFGGAGARKNLVMITKGQNAKHRQYEDAVESAALAINNFVSQRVVKAYASVIPILLYEVWTDGGYSNEGDIGDANSRGRGEVMTTTLHLKCTIYESEYSRCGAYFEQGRIEADIDDPAFEDFEVPSDDGNASWDSLERFWCRRQLVNKMNELLRGVSILSDGRVSG